MATGFLAVLRVVAPEPWASAQRLKSLGTLSRIALATGFLAVAWRVVAPEPWASAQRLKSVRNVEPYRTSDRFYRHSETTVSPLQGCLLCQCYATKYVGAKIVLEGQ